MILNFQKNLNKDNLVKIQVPLFLIIFTSILVGIISLNRKEINVIIDGQPKTLVTYKKVLKDALESNNISVGSKDKISLSIDSKIADKDTINIKKAIKVNVFVDDENLMIVSAEDSVLSMLKAETIPLREGDKVFPSKDALLTKDMNIEIVRVDEASFTEKQNLDFKTIIKHDDNWPNAKKQIVQEGKLGEKSITTKVVYENGKETSRTIVKEEVVSQPVDKIVVQGSLPTLHVSRGGEPVGYTKVINAKATAYYAIYGVGTTYTASGRLAVRDTNGYSTIAVDPKVIPYGTKLYVEGYGFAIAADTGSSIVGNTIDVYFNTYNEACNWGLKYVNVYVIK